MARMFNPTYLLLISLPIIATSCGSSTKDSSEEEIVVVIDNDTDEPLQTGGRKMSIAADSMALYADDLSPKQALTVLSTFYRVHLEARANGERRKDIQTKRKFIDVYDIVMANHRDELRRLMIRAYEADSTLNLPGAIQEFKGLLEDYDAAHGQGGEYVQSRIDSVATPSDTHALEAIDASSSASLTEDPVEFRPAE